MEATLRLELTGELSELSALEDAMRAVVTNLVPTASVVATEPPADEPFWTPDRADSLVQEITDDSRLGLRAICEGAPEVPFDSVLTVLDCDGPTAGGKMGSITFATTRLGLDPPFSRNYPKRRYSIDPKTAAVLLAAIDRMEQA